MVCYIDFSYTFAFLTFNCHINYCSFFFSFDPVKPQFYYISIGLKELSSTRRCFHDALDFLAFLSVDFQ